MGIIKDALGVEPGASVVDSVEALAVPVRIPPTLREKTQLSTPPEESRRHN